MHPTAAQMLASLGGDASNFAARQLTSRVASSADLIITMSAEHRERVLELAPYRLHRTFTLTEVSALCSDADVFTFTQAAALRSRLAPNQKKDIADPIGMNYETFEEVGEEIATLLLPVLEFCKNHHSLND